MNLLRVWDMYRQDRMLAGYSPNTMRQYRLNLEFMIRYFGADKDIREISETDLRQYLIDTTGHLSANSLSTRIRFIKAFFRWSIDKGLIPLNPAFSLVEPRKGRRVPKAISEEDIEALRIACEETVDHVILEILYATGCRIGEIYRMDRDHVDMDRRAITVLGKGDNEREVYFDTRCYIWLKRYFEMRKDNDPALIVTVRAPRRMSIARMRERLKEVAKVAGVEVNVYPHKLRHTYAMHLLNNGAPMELIQELLGHVKLDTTRIYAQLSGERRRELYRRYY